jgi:hypothetical protein
VDTERRVDSEVPQQCLEVDLKTITPGASILKNITFQIDSVKAN